MYLYYLGLDLGQPSEMSALAIIEEQVFIGEAWANEILYREDYERGVSPGWVSPASITPYQAREALWHARRFGRPAEAPLAVRHLERFESGASYADMARKVAGISRTPPLWGTPRILLIDKTGVGGAALDTFTRAGVGATAITLHAGSALSRDPQRAGFRVPRRDLITTTQVLLQNGHLMIADALPEAQTLKNELLDYREKVEPRTARDSYEVWREGRHDDLVLGVSMGAWFREWWNKHTDTALARRLRRTNQAMVY